MPNWKKLITSGSDASLSTLTINNSGSTADSLTITATEDSSTAAPVITLKRNSNSPADADYIGQIKFKGENDADQEVVYAKITGKINDASDGTEDGNIEFANKRGGLNVITARLSSDKLQLLNGTDFEVDGGSISGSTYYGDGSNLTGINASIVSSSTVSDTFTSVTAYTASHAFGTKDVIVNVYDDNDRMVIPQEITTLSTTSVGIDFGTSVTGRVVIGKAGHIVSGSVAIDTDFQNMAEHIIPSTADTYDLGSVAKPWRDLYLSDASLYIDGTQVISSTSDTVTFSTDAGQSIKLLETGADDIILQTDTGNIELKGTVEILTGKKITDSAGSVVRFGNSIGITGSIETTGTVDGIDLQTFSSSVATSLSNVASDWDSVTNKPAGIVSSSAQTLANLAGSTILSGSSETIFSYSFNNLTAVSASHGFNSKEVIVYIYDTNDNLIYPSNIKTATVDDVYIQFNTSRSGRVVISKGGHIVNGTTSNAFSSSYIQGTNVDGAVSTVENNNSNSGSLSFWQGSQSEYDLISGSADNNTVYFVI